MSAKQGTVWKAEPHTIAKIEMLRSYLFPWFAMLGRTFVGQPLWYIDGFAGPGEYTNFKQGSPIAALAAAAAALDEAGAGWKAGDIHCVFIDEDPARVGHLKSKLEDVPPHARLHRHVLPGTFVEGLAELKGCPTNPFSSGSPLFAFIDPFGPRGLSFSAVRALLARPTTEVLINLDSDGISRIYSAGEDANHRALLNDVFGDSTWENELAGASQAQAVTRVLALYKSKLRAISKVRYVFSFEMRKKSNVFDYHLVFASQHARGLEKMKEVMKRIDQDGSYCFSDDHVSQQTLFRFDEPSVAALQMGKHFAGRTITYSDANEYALNDSPFVNPKAMLAVLEQRGDIVVDVGAQKRTKGTYPERLHAIMRLKFRAGDA